MFLRFISPCLFGRLLFLVAALTAVSALGSTLHSAHATLAAIAADVQDSSAGSHRCHVIDLNGGMGVSYPDGDGMALLDQLNLEDNGPDDQFDVPVLFVMDLPALVGARPIGKLPTATDAFIGRELRPPII